MIKIMITDDQKLFRESLKNILEQDEEIEVLVCAENGQEAFQLCGKFNPDVILMDIKMPVCDGIEGAKRIKEKYPQIKIIMLTVLDENDNANVRQALENWADGYIFKDVSPEDLIQVIKNTARGFRIFSEKAYDRLRNDLHKITKTVAPMESNLNINLKDNEKQIIQYIAEGKNNKEIANLLFLSEGRVKNIISELLTKLGLKDRYQLLGFAYKNNLIK